MEPCTFWYETRSRECGSFELEPHGGPGDSRGSVSSHDYVAPPTDRKKLRDWLGMFGSLCEFPGCSTQARQMAHLRSIGMGGRKTADRYYNVMRVCDTHALVTDGLPPVGEGTAAYFREMERIPGYGLLLQGGSTHRFGMDLLRNYILKQRGGTGLWQI